jgi:HK97 family phage portal protein
MPILGQLSNIIKKAMNRARDVFATYIPDWMANVTWSQRGYRTNVRLRYTFNELIFACVTLNASTAANVQLRVKGRRTNTFEDDHPMRLLLENPNPYMSEADLWETVIMHQQLAGRCVLEKERNRRGEVIGLWPLRPDWLEVVPSVTTLIAGFTYGPPGTKKVFIPYDDTVDIPLRHPDNPIVPFETLAPVTVAARVVDVDSQVTEFLKLFFERGGVPPGILKTRQKLIESDVDLLRKRWRERYGGYTKWTEPAILDSDAEYQRIGATFEEMGFIVLDRRNESRICMIMKVPPIVVGAYAGLELGSYDNYLTARKAWWEDSNIPRFEQIGRRVQLELGHEFDNPIVEWDYSRVQALQDNKEISWKLAAEVFRTGAITKNMYLEMLNMPQLGPAGDVFLHSLAYVVEPYKKPAQRGASSEAEIFSVAKVDTPELPSGVKIDEDLREKRENELEQAAQDGLDEMFKRLQKELEENGAQAILAE